MKKRFQFTISLLIFAILLPLILFSCNSTQNNGNNGTNESEEVTSAPPVPVSLDNYTVIRAESASDTIRNSASKLFGELKVIATGNKISDDWLKAGDAPAESAKEILIGSTTRNESAEVVHGLPLNDYVIRYFEESGRIVICGGCDDSTADAVDYFIKNYLSNISLTLPLLLLSMYMECSQMLCVILLELHLIRCI